MQAFWLISNQVSLTTFLCNVSTYNTYSIVSSLLFSRLHCYTVRSAIGIIKSSIHPSVMPCIVDLRVGVHGKKLYQCVPSRHVIICLFRHLCCSKNCIATKHTEKWIKQIANLRVFWDRQSGMYWSCYVPLFIDFVKYWTLNVIVHLSKVSYLLTYLLIC